MATPSWQNIAARLWKRVEEAEQEKITEILNMPAAAQRQLTSEQGLLAVGPFARSLCEALNGGEIVGWDDGSGGLVQVPQEARDGLRAVADQIAVLYFNVYDRQTAQPQTGTSAAVKNKCVQEFEGLIASDSKDTKTFKAIRNSFLRSGQLTIGGLKKEKARKEAAEKHREEQLAANAKKAADEKKEKAKQDREDKKHRIHAAAVNKEERLAREEKKREEKVYTSSVMAEILEWAYDHPGDLEHMAVWCKLKTPSGDEYWDSNKSPFPQNMNKALVDILRGVVPQMINEHTGGYRQVGTCAEVKAMHYWLTETGANAIPRGGHSIAFQIMNVDRAQRREEDGIRVMNACANCQQWLQNIGWTWTKPSN